METTNVHPYLHALVTNGVMTRDGEFLDLPHWTPQVLEEIFRRPVLKRLVQAERLSEEFQETLLGWVHRGSRCTKSGWSRAMTCLPWNVWARYALRASVRSMR